MGYNNIYLIFKIIYNSIIKNEIMNTNNVSSTPNIFYLLKFVDPEILNKECDEIQKIFDNTIEKNIRSGILNNDIDLGLLSIVFLKKGNFEKAFSAAVRIQQDNKYKIRIFTNQIEKERITIDRKTILRTIASERNKKFYGDSPDLLKKIEGWRKACMDEESKMESKGPN